MKPSLFITGAGGFVGKHLLEKLDYSQYDSITCLELKMENVQLPDSAVAANNVKIIEADLLDSEAYESALQHVDTVIHLAALTGKADPKDYFKVNTYGTMLLLDRCKKAGVKHFLFISSIAVSFRNTTRYFYAHSKEQAENHVKSSGLNYTIIRPTMIMGHGAAVFDGLSKLAGLPFIPIFGQGDVEIQPIDVQDVAKAILRIVSETRFNGEILELGGPETLTIKEFLVKIAQAMGKPEPKVMHLPITIIVFFLSILERFVYGLLPITVGQLATFRNDGSATPNFLTKKLSAMMLSIDEMIQRGLQQDEPLEIPAHLKKECAVLCNYLTGMKPNDYVLGKYKQCHEVIDFTPRDFHDGLLMKLARTGFFFPRMTDIYSRFFRPNSLVRKKLAYLMAILEVSPPYFRFYDSAGKSGLFGLFIKLGFKGIYLGFNLLFAFLFFFPLQVLAKLTSKPAETTEH